MSDSDYTPRWQDDSEVHSCFLCGSHYNWFNRRHHCRKCGRVVCGNCSDQAIKYFPRTLIVTPTGVDTRGHPSEIYRTCDECVEEIRMIRSALFDNNLELSRENVMSDLDSRGSSNGSRTGLRSHSGRDILDDDRNSIAKYSRTRTSTRRLDSSTNSSSSNLNGSQRDDTSDHNLCPVCATSMLDAYINTHKTNIGDISNDDFEMFKEDHIKNCLTSYDFDYNHGRFNHESSKNNHPRNKMLVYNMPPIPKPQFETIPNTDGIESTSYDTLKQFHSNDTVQNPAGMSFPVNANNNIGPSYDSFNIGSVTSNSTMQQNEKFNDIDENECVICLEDLKPGDKVGRLECLCVFHYKCIKDWFNKKGYGECPVHYLQH